MLVTHASFWCVFSQVVALYSIKSIACADNIHLGQDGQLRLLGFGVSLSLRETKADEVIGFAGAPSYMAPELFANPQPMPGSRIFTCSPANIPAGKSSRSRPRFDEPTPPTRWRTVIPGWLENILLKAVARGASESFETAKEFMIAGRHGRGALPERNSLQFWKAVAALSLAANLILLVPWLR